MRKLRVSPEELRQAEVSLWSSKSPGVTGVGRPRTHTAWCSISIGNLLSHHIPAHLHVRIIRIANSIRVQLLLTWEMSPDVTLLQRMNTQSSEMLQQDLTVSCERARSAATCTSTCSFCFCRSRILIRDAFMFPDRPPGPKPPRATLHQDSNLMLMLTLAVKEKTQSDITGAPLPIYPI